MSGRPICHRLRQKPEKLGELRRDSPGSPMIIGDPDIFAIETEITQAFARRSWLALGYFNIHVGGRRYGIHSPHASLLACSFDEVKNRLARRGKHVAPFARDPDAGRIADAVRCAIYASVSDNTMFFDLVQPDFREIIESNQLIWAPDGDQAFDDGSYVVQFDVDDQVRLIAFKSLKIAMNLEH